MRLLTFTTLYPNAVQPWHGVFVENRLQLLRARPDVQVAVVAPVPWFPSGAARFGRYAQFARVPPRETRNGIDVLHPRYPVIPKIGTGVAPLLLAAALWPTVKRLRGSFDVIDAHYFYPDGVAAVMVARRLAKPVVVTARGSDVNLFGELAIPRRWIRWAARHCDAVITVSQALRDRLATIGAACRVEVLRNGVDLELFSPGDRAAARRELGIDGGTVLLSVGKLNQAKGHDLVVRALADLPQCKLIIVGEGEYSARLRAIAVDVGVADRVRFAGSVAHAELKSYYRAADALVLASEREGMPNVVLESMACGTPVIATDVGGVAEVLDSAAGIVLRERTPAAVRAAVDALRGQPRPAEAVRRAAGRFAWAPVISRQIDLYRDVVRGRAGE